MFRHGDGETSLCDRCMYDGVVGCLMYLGWMDSAG
jgi:hypothetical protein